MRKHAFTTAVAMDETSTAEDKTAGHSSMALQGTAIEGLYIVLSVATVGCIAITTATTVAVIDSPKTVVH